MDLALLSRKTRGGDREMESKMTVKKLLRRCAKAAPLAAVLAASLALSACDKCFDFPWDRPGSCKSAGRCPAATSGCSWRSRSSRPTR